MSLNSNKKKDALLGEPHGTASNRLRKSVLFQYVKLAGHDVCFRCAGKIENIKDFSIEHKTPWQTAPDPKTAFFDLTDIAFSHLLCNSTASTGRKPRKFEHGISLYSNHGCRCDVCREAKSRLDPRRPKISVP